MCASSISLAITVIIVVLETCNVIINAVIVTSNHCYCYHPHLVLTPIIIVILIMFSLVLVTIIVIWLIHLLLIEMVITSISETWLAPLPTTCLVPPTQRGNIPKGTPAPSKHHQAHPNSYGIKI